MRILNLIPKLSGGGAERQLGYLLPELVRMGHDVHVAYYIDSDPNPKLHGVNFHKLRASSSYDPRLLWQVILLIKRIKPDIIHTWIFQMDVLGGLGAKIFRIPNVLREPSSHLNYLPNLKNRLRVWIGSTASAIVSNSLGGDAYWKKYLPSGHQYIVRNGLPLKEIENGSPPLPTPFSNIDIPIILYVGRLASGRSGNKNLEILLQSLAIVKQQKNCIGILCGDGPQRNHLEQLREQLNLTHDICFSGNLDPASVWALMKKASIFISLSEYEGCPNSVMEAMALGCPLVLSDIPAHNEITDMSSALFVDPKNSVQIADSILQILNDSQAAKIRAENAYRRSRDWSITKMATEYENVYKECIQQV